LASESEKAGKVKHPAGIAPSIKAGNANAVLSGGDFDSGGSGGKSAGKLKGSPDVFAGASAAFSHDHRFSFVQATPGDRRVLWMHSDS
jgi:ABC-type branched-subunit amino acid transport system substrate-binding protein